MRSLSTYGFLTGFLLVFGGVGSIESSSLLMGLSLSFVGVLMLFASLPTIIKEYE